MIYTSLTTCQLINEDVSKFNNQYGGLTIKDTKNIHDRFIIIDSIKLYHVGHSLKDLGKKISCIGELDNGFITMLINKIIR